MNDTRDGHQEPSFSFTFRGSEVGAISGQSIAAALAREGVVAWNRTESGALRGYYCGAGHCFDCAVRVDGRVALACLTAAEPGLSVEAFRE